MNFEFHSCFKYLKSNFNEIFVFKGKYPSCKYVSVIIMGIVQRATVELKTEISLNGFNSKK